MGELYENGLGVAKNYKIAAEYYEAAVDLGYEEVAEDLARLYETGGYGLKKDIRKSKQYKESMSDY